jgi:septin 7
MLSNTISNLFTQIKNGLSAGHLTLAKYLHAMSVALSGLHTQSRVSRSEGVLKDLPVSVKEVEDTAISRPYPGSLHRNQRAPPVIQYRSMLDVDDAPTLRPIAIPQEESMETWVTEKLGQAARKHTTTSSDWADILCFYTATNGVASAAPTRTPAPVPNGKAVSPSQEVPQSVSSTDPKVAAQQASDMRNIVRRKLTGYVGFANLPNQWHRKSVRKGFNFNVMVVGTFIPWSHN